MQSNSTVNAPDLTDQFLVGILSTVFRRLLTPVYLIMRNDIGVRNLALIPLVLSAFGNGAIAAIFARKSEIDAKVVSVCFILTALGYLRNSIQSRRRRLRRDWSVHSWSAGTSLLEPILLVVCRQAVRIWGNKFLVKKATTLLLKDDFIYYVGEPFALAIVAAALHSIGATLAFYPILLAIALIFVRNDAQLYSYLQAYDVMDGKKLEREIRLQIEGSGISQQAPARMAQIPAVPGERIAVDRESVFERLSPELQTLLIRDQLKQP